ncbi:MAG: hypothetical protein EHM61_06405 [Acidobacteria bacterium]|nr:MAG: hypothetical protein EHM61_06405 [Acidobacteriota bacterium]
MCFVCFVVKAQQRDPVNSKARVDLRRRWAQVSPHDIRDSRAVFESPDDYERLFALVADYHYVVPDDRIPYVLDVCQELSERFEGSVVNSSRWPIVSGQ